MSSDLMKINFQDADNFVVKHFNKGQTKQAEIFILHKYPIELLVYQMPKGFI